MSLCSCFCPPFSTAVTSAAIHVFPPGAGKQCQTFITFQRAVARCLRKHLLPLLLLRSHSMAWRVARGFYLQRQCQASQEERGQRSPSQACPLNQQGSGGPVRGQSHEGLYQDLHRWASSFSKLRIGIPSPGKYQGCGSAFR